MTTYKDLGEGLQEMIFQSACLGVRGFELASDEIRDLVLEDLADLYTDSLDELGYKYKLESTGLHLPDFDDLDYDLALKKAEAIFDINISARYPHVLEHSYLGRVSRRDSQLSLAYRERMADGAILTHELELQWSGQGDFPWDDFERQVQSRIPDHDYFIALQKEVRFELQAAKALAA